MNKRQIIASLNKVANELDNSGMLNEASQITNVMKRLSQLTQNETQPPAANALNERAQAGQMNNAQIAQNFIEKNKSNPNFKTAQDFYYEAQKQGMPQSMMNSIAALAKSEGFTDKTRFVD